MAARLMRCYGGTLHAWLADVPMLLIATCARLIPRLRAEEGQAFAEAVAVGISGGFTTGYSAAVQRSWHALEPRRPRAQKMTPELLARAGIALKRVKVTDGRR